MGDAAMDEETLMRIGILGSADVGKAFARAFVARGHEVMIGSRDPDKLREFAGEHAGLRIGTNEETARFGDLMVIATLFSGTKNALELAGPENFAGKVVIDATNPLRFEEGKLPQLSTGFDTSAGEEIQRWLPGAKVVKAFNTVGNALFSGPKFAQGPPTMFIAGNDAQAKKTVADIAASFGWEPLDVGGIEESRYLEPLAVVWIHYAFKTGTWNHAFKMLRSE
jgi:predicted dinucleotide-binding enzyme